MKRLAATLIFCATALFADTAETVFFRGVMSPTNEVPAVPSRAPPRLTGCAHRPRRLGQNRLGHCGLHRGLQLSGSGNLDRLHIHQAPAGVNGAIMIRTDLGAGSLSIVSDTEPARSTSPGRFCRPIRRAQRDQWNDGRPQSVLREHSLHRLPGGAMRAQLQRAK